MAAFGVLATAACGARWTDEQQAAAVAAFNGDGRVDSELGTSRAGNGTRPSAGATVAPGQAGSGDATSPDATTPEGAPTGAQGGAGPQSATLPCAAPSSETGVDDSTITLGAISTQQGPVPGLGATMAAGARAYVEYQNSIGGVCGRQIVLQTGDDAFDNGQNRAVVSDLSRRVLGFAGSFGLADGGGADVIESGNIPYTGLYSTETMSLVSSMFSARPPFADPSQPIAKYEYLYAQGVRSAALVYTAADQARHQMQDIERPQMEAAGITIATTQEVPLSTLSFDSTARAVANSGADYMLFLSDASYSASMARSMEDTGYELKYEEYLTGYGSNYIELAGGAAEGTTSWIPSLPDEDPEVVPAQGLYHEWMSFVAPDLRPDIFSAAAWASMEAFMTALQNLPGPITRTAVVDALRAIGTFDAGGLLGPVNFGAKENLGCLIGMQVREGRWTRLTPEQGFLC